MTIVNWLMGAGSMIIVGLYIKARRDYIMAVSHYEEVLNELIHSKIKERILVQLAADEDKE